MKQSTMPRFLALAAAAALLAGCKDESASMRLAGPEHALTLVMRQDYPWSKEYRFEAVMVRTPDCHRRSRLDSVAPGEVRVDVHRPPEGVFAEPILILKEGAKHYAVSTQNCEMQRFTATPPEIGPRLGSFDRQGGKLRFASAPPPKVAPQSVPAPAAPAIPAAAPPQAQ